MRAVQGLLPALSHVPDLPEGSRAQGTDTGADKGQLVNYSERKRAMTDPIADMLTRIGNGAKGGHERVDDAWGRVSKPSIRVYVGFQEIPPIRKGLGVNILSTPKGVLADRDAQKAKVGGELICAVW